MCIGTGRSTAIDINKHESRMRWGIIPGELRTAKLLNPGLFIPVSMTLCSNGAATIQMNIPHFDIHLRVEIYIKAAF